MTETSGLSIPPKSDELKKKEEEILHGSDLRVKVKLPDGQLELLQIKNSTEVGYVKLLISQKFGYSVRNVSLLFNGKPMIDPMSFCDHPGVLPPEIEVQAVVADSVS